MKKRYVSLLLIFTLICTMFAPALTVSAAGSMTELSDYWFAYGNEVAIGDGKLAEISTAQSFSGTKSLHVQKSANNNVLYVQNLSQALEHDTLYNVEFYVYNNTENAMPSSALYYVSDNGKGMHNLTVDNNTGKTGWTKYTHQWRNSITSNQGSGFWFQFNNACEVDLYIDDIKVWKEGDATQTNVIRDAGFEDGFGTATAIPTIEGFTVQYVNPADNSKFETQPTDVYEVAVKNDASYDAGGNSLYIKREGYYTERARQTKLISTEATTFVAGTNYTLTFYTDKQFDTYTANRSYFYMGSGTNVWLKNMDCEEQSNGWFKYSYTQAATNNTALFFILRGYMDMHIDEISVVAEGTEENKTPSGSFGEGSGSIEPEVPAIPYTAYEPKNVILNSYQRFYTATSVMPLMLSWENPTGEVAISNITVYDVTSGTPSEISLSNISKSAKAVNAHYIGDYSVDTVHTFRLVFAFADGKTTSIEASIKPESPTSTIIGSVGKQEGSGWIKYYQNGSSTKQPYMMPADITVDSNVYYGTEASGKSMHITANKAPDASATRPADFSSTNTGNYYLRTYYRSNSNGMAISELGATYRVKFYAKGDLTTATDGSINLQIQESAGSGALLNVTPFATYMGQTIDNWTPFTAEFTTTKANTYCRLLFQVNCAVSDLWIDNIECYKLENGVETGENLVGCSTFEDVSAATDVESISVEGGNGKAIVNYNAGSATKVYIYEKTTENDKDVLKLRAIADPNGNQITINGLENDSEYEFVYVTQSNRYVLSEAKTIGTVTPDAPSFEITSYKLYDSTSEVADITAAGDYTVEISLTNNKEASLDASLIIALCKGTEIVTVVEDPRTITLGDTADFEAKVNGPQSDDYTTYKIKAFLWDSLDGMKPLNVACEF